MVEKLKYEVVRKLEKSEVRRYDSFILAKVDSFGDTGFNILFRYISGNNKQRKNVEMTAPVFSEKIPMNTPVLSDSSSIAFVMPEGYELDSTPEPLDERIKIIEVPPRLVAALRFSGRWSKSRFTKKSEELIEELRNADINSKGEVFVMRYSGPFTPWFMRRNEVAIEVERDN